MDAGSIPAASTKSAASRASRTRPISGPQVRRPGDEIGCFHLLPYGTGAQQAMLWAGIRFGEYGNASPSTRQSAEQPSPSSVLPSSHPSPQDVSTVPLPQLSRSPTQAPLRHWSLIVHTSPSLQEVPFGLTVFDGQALLTPLHDSATSQSPTAARHTPVLFASGGQVAL